MQEGEQTRKRKGGKKIDARGRRDTAAVSLSLEEKKGGCFRSKTKQ